MIVNFLGCDSRRGVFVFILVVVIGVAQPNERRVLRFVFDDHGLAAIVVHFFDLRAKLASALIHRYANRHHHREHAGHREAGELGAFETFEPMKERRSAPAKLAVQACKQRVFVFFRRALAEARDKPDACPCYS